MNVEDKNFLTRHSVHEKRFARMFNRVLRKNYLEIADLFEERKPLEEVNTEMMRKAYTRLYTDVMKSEGWVIWNQYVKPITGERVNKKDVFDEVASTFGTSQDPKEMQGFWNRLMNGFLNTYVSIRITEVMGTTINRVKKLISKERGLGLSDKEIADMIRTDARVQELRANTIARTETTNAMSKSQILALESSGLNWLKAWRAIRDDRTRDAHYMTEPTLFIPIKENFVIGGQVMAYPGDSTQGATVGNFINCRCRLAFRQENSSVVFSPKN